MRLSLAAAMKLEPKLQAWIDARQRHRPSHADVQMARELGMAPASLRGLDDHQHEPWKAPLAAFIEQLYLTRFGRPSPVEVQSLEARARRQAARIAAKKATRAPRRAAAEIKP